MACNEDGTEPVEASDKDNEEEGIWMSLDEAKVEDELLTKVLREPFEYNTPTLNSPSVETESQTSHHHPQFSEKDYLKKRHSHVHLHTPLKPHTHHHGKKEKTKKGHKKKKLDDASKAKSPEKQKVHSIEKDGITVTPEVKDNTEEKLEKSIVDQKITVLPEIGEDTILATPPKTGFLSELLPEEKLETSIVDQTISILPEIGEDEILATPPKIGFLSELTETPSETVVVETPKETKASRHRHKHHEQKDKNEETPKSGRHKHHHRHRHKSELQERRRPGVATIKEKDKISSTIPEAVDDGTALNLKDVEDMTFHRFEDLKGMHRRPVRLRRSGMTTHFSNQDLSASLRSLVSHIKPPPRKKTYDHRPHENFVELEELTTVGEETEWKERARWIKFEEDVEESLRWGKPHIPSLSFHSLLELRRGLETGAVLLDLEQFDLSSIAEAVIDEMVITDQLPRAHSAKVLSALLAKHRHQHQMNKGLPRRSSSTNLAAFFGVETKTTPLKPTETDAVEQNATSPACEATENITFESTRPRITSDASSQTPLSTLDYLEKVCLHVRHASVMVRNIVVGV